MVCSRQSPGLEHNQWTHICCTNDVRIEWVQYYILNFVRPSVRCHFFWNLGQFLSDHFHTAYGPFYHHYECFYRKIFDPPQPQSLFLDIRGCFSQKLWGHRFQPIWNFPVWIFMFLESLGLSLGFFLVFFVAQIWFLGPGRGRVTWGSSKKNFSKDGYISSESIFDADFEFWICLVQFNFWAWGGGQVGVTWGSSKMNFFKHDSRKAFLMWILNFRFFWPNFNFWARGVFILF